MFNSPHSYRLFPLVCLASLMFAIWGFSQSPPLIEWERTLGGENLDSARSVQECAGGGYIVAGSTSSFSDDGSSRAYLIRVDERGVILWDRTYGQSPAFGGHVEETSGGDLIVVGGLGTPESGPSLYLFKTDSGGDTLWERSFPGLGAGTYIEEDSRGGYIMTAYAAEGSNSQIYLLRTDEIGEKLWDRRIDGIDGVAPGAVHEYTGGGYIVTGRGGLNDPWGSGKPYVALTDDAGFVLWQKDFEIGRVASAQETHDGNVVVAAQKYIEEPIPGAPGSFTLLVHLDPAGEELWRTELASPDNGTDALDETPDGRVVVLGSSYTTTSTRRESHLVKADRSGCFWNRRFLGTSSESGGFVRATSDGGYIVVGGINQDIYLAKLGPEGGDDGFVRGNADGNGSLDLTDAVFALNWLFQSGPQPWILDAADSNDDGTVDLTDAVYILSYLFLGGPPPLSPHPQAGSDPTHDQLGCQG